MIPRQEAELQKKQAEFQKFHPHWKGEGHRLGVNIIIHFTDCLDSVLVQHLS